MIGSAVGVEGIGVPKGSLLGGLGTLSVFQPTNKVSGRIARPTPLGGYVFAFAQESLRTARF
jgi:hypothetical protein